MTPTMYTHRVYSSSSKWQQSGVDSRSLTPREEGWRVKKSVKSRTWPYPGIAGNHDFFTIQPSSRGVRDRESTPDCCHLLELLYTPWVYIVGVMGGLQTRFAPRYVPYPPLTHLSRNLPSYADVGIYKIHLDVLDRTFKFSPICGAV